MKKLCFVATVPEVVTSFLKEHIRASAAQWSVTVVTNSASADFLKGTGATFVPLPVERKVFLWRDLRALLQLMALFRRERFDMVHSIMPKTGLLTMLAGWLTGVPHRIHTFTGQVWATRCGWRRTALKFFDKLIVRLATRVLVDSPSQRDFLLAEGVLTAGKGEVIGHGSICGVDTERFHPSPEIRNTVRRELNISEHAVVVIFLGRLNRDKGMLDLADAFTRVASSRPEALLLLVGAEEDVTFPVMQQRCTPFQGRLRKVDFTPVPERYMAAADIFCLPSYREGFGQVIIEAAAAGLPSVCSRIYGITDAVEDERTGLLIAPGDIHALTRALESLLDDTSLRQKMGAAARQRVQNLFSSYDITQKMLILYRGVLTDQ